MSETTVLALEARIHDLQRNAATIREISDELDRLPADVARPLYRKLVEQLAPWR